MPNINLGTSRAKLNDLKSQRATHLENAEKELNAGNTAEYKVLLAKAQAMNPQIEDLESLVKEYDRYDIAHAPKFGNDPKDQKAMGEMLMAGERVGFAADVVKQALVSNAATLFSGNIVAPTGGSTNINDGFNAQVSSLIDQVRVETFEGLNAWEESYLKSMPTATKGKPATVAGTTRSDSAAAWRKAKLIAHEVQTTAFVDRNISRLSPAAYAAKAQIYALKSLRKEINNMIVNGDGTTTPEVFGLINAKNTNAEAIFDTSGVTAINEDTLRSMVFGYGGDEEVSANARMVLNKLQLEALGKLKIGTGDNRPLYDITQQGNTGTIKSGGLIVPYTISSAVAANKLIYADPMAYLLALFGSYTIRVDESVKSVERMIAILGDVLVGGNLTVDKGALVADIANTAAATTTP